MPEIEIRSASSEDIEGLSAFEHGYYSEYVWQMNITVDTESTGVDFRRVRLPRRVFVPYPRQREKIFSDLAKVEVLLIAVLNHRSVGYIKVQADSDSTVARVSDIVVSAPMRRQGIASGLLLAVMDLITRRNFHTLILEMQSKNDPALNMAAKLGFNFCGFQDHYFPNHDLALFFSRFAR